MADEKGRRGGTSSPGTPDRGAAPQPGRDPAGAAARREEAQSRGPGAGPVAPTPKTETTDETGATEEMKRKALKDPPVQPLSGTTRMQED